MGEKYGLTFTTHLLSTGAALWNEAYIVLHKTLAEVILFCAKQEISLREHDEGEESVNKDNIFGIN